MAPQTQVNSATLIMGVTGSGKSSLARTLADYLWETHKKVLYFYSSDGGGIPAKVQEGVALGIIKLWRMRTRDPGDLGLAFETCYRAAQGYWPRRIDPKTGQTAPGVEMVAPIVKRFVMICPNGHEVKKVLLQNHLSPQGCPTCKVMVTAQNMTVRETLTESAGFEDRGGCYFDGLSSMLSWGKMEMGQRAGRLELKGEEGSIGGKVISGELKFGGTTRSHVGFVQDRGEELAHLALGIPNLLVPPVFTALSMEASDEAALSVVGPKISGRAKTDEAPQWFGNCLETAKIPAEVGAGEQFCLYLSEFTDMQGRRHLIKNRAAPGTMPDKLIDPVEGPAFSEFNLGRFYRMLDQALRAGIEAAMLVYPDAPGLPEGIVEYGDGGQSTPVAPVQSKVAAAAGGATTMQAPVAAGAPAQAGGAPAAPAAAPRAQAGKKKAAAAPAPTAPAAPAAPAVEAPPVEETAVSTVEATPVVEAAAPAPVPETATAAPVAVAPAAPVAPAAVAPVAPRPAGVAPPPGRRPMTQAPPTQAGAPTQTNAVPPSVVPRPPAAPPRAPQAARPPAARPATAPPTTT